MQLETVAKRWLPAVLWGAMIFAFSGMPGADFAPTKSNDFLIRKTLHLVEYMLLCLCFYRATKSTLKAVVLTIMYAATDEWHQTFVPTRTGKISDVAFDSAAAVLTGLVLWKFYQYLPSKLKIWLEE